MNGRVKDFFWDQITAEAEDGPCEPDPNDLESLAIDAELARERYQRALEKQTAKGHAHDKSI